MRFFILSSTVDLRIFFLIVGFFSSLEGWRLTERVSEGLRVRKDSMMSDEKPR
jgi:hypothetical protein